MLYSHPTQLHGISIIILLLARMCQLLFARAVAAVRFTYVDVGVIVISCGTLAKAVIKGSVKCSFTIQITSIILSYLRFAGATAELFPTSFFTIYTCNPIRYRLYYDYACKGGIPWFHFITTPVAISCSHMHGVGQHLCFIHRSFWRNTPIAKL